MWCLYDTLFAMLLLGFYLSFEVTKKSKAFLCLVACALSAIAIAYNVDKVIFHPDESGFFVDVVSSYMRQYLAIDLLYHLSVSSQAMRKDMLIHHVICLFSYYYLHDCFSVAFVASAEIISVPPLFFTCVPCGKQHFREIPTPDFVRTLRQYPILNSMLDSYIYLQNPAWVFRGNVVSHMGIVLFIIL